MSFSSLEFLFLFLPAVLALNYILPAAARNYWLLAASLFFYAWGDPSFLFLLILSVIINYSFGILLSEISDRISLLAENTDAAEQNNSSEFRKLNILFFLRRFLFIFVITINLSVLFITKYMNFITEVLRSCFPLWEGAIPKTSFLLPLGISFYTFQSIGYVIDIYRGMPAEKNPCNYALFITFFPQLLQGPILRYQDFSAQLCKRSVSSEQFSDGVIRFLTGFNQKVLLANILSGVVEQAFSTSELSTGMAWIGMLTYSMQLYFDFSGYSDMAIGLGQMFGFRMKENFDFPYISQTITEFWRRWHISLGSWFRDYLYFPLGGSRVSSKARIALNLAIVWLATGIWHGANWTFILWGVLHGSFVIFEKLSNLPKRLAHKKGLKRMYQGFILLVTVYAWMLFRASDLTHAVFYTKSLVHCAGILWIDSSFKFYFREYIFTIILGFVCALPILKTIRTTIYTKKPESKGILQLIRFVIQLLLAVISLSSLVMNSHNPFLYANF